VRTQQKVVEVGSETVFVLFFLNFKSASILLCLDALIIVVLCAVLCPVCCVCVCGIISKLSLIFFWVEEKCFPYIF
jgi:hypothetical protein